MAIKRNELQTTAVPGYRPYSIFPKRYIWWPRGTNEFAPNQIHKVATAAAAAAPAAAGNLKNQPLQG